MGILDRLFGSSKRSTGPYRVVSDANGRRCTHLKKDNNQCKLFGCWNFEPDIVFDSVTGRPCAHTKFPDGHCFVNACWNSRLMAISPTIAMAVDANLREKFIDTADRTLGPAWRDEFGDIDGLVKATVDQFPENQALPADSNPAYATRTAILSTGARDALRGLFVKRCDGEGDALLAASAISHALDSQGPANRAADRIRMAARMTDRMAFIEELRAFTIARYGEYWLHLVDMYGSWDAVHNEMQDYLAVFGYNLSGHLEELRSKRLALIPNSGAVSAWGAALGTLGSVWVDGRTRGTPPSDLFELLWHVR